VFKPKKDAKAGLINYEYNPALRHFCGYFLLKKNNKKKEAKKKNKTTNHKTTNHKTQKNVSSLTPFFCF